LRKRNNRHEERISSFRFRKKKGKNSTEKPLEENLRRVNEGDLKKNSTVKPTSKKEGHPFQPVKKKKREKQTSANREGSEGQLR